MRCRYVVLGCGRQGTAAACDLARFEDAASLVVADRDPAAAQRCAARVGSLPGLRESGVGRPRVRAIRLDAGGPRALARALRGADAVVNALPHAWNLPVARAAVRAGASCTDLGGPVDGIRGILRLDAEARRSGSTLVPAMGLAPGLATVLAVRAMEALSACRSVKIYCGGLPRIPRPPLGYRIAFDPEGLWASYAGTVHVLRDGRVAAVPPLGGQEEVDFGPPLGRLEAALTSGGASTCPWSFAGRIRTFEYRTLRYPGHFDKIRMLAALGLLEDSRMEVGGVRVSPRRLLTAVAAARLAFPEDRDVVLLRVVARGTRGGRPGGIRYDLIQRMDPASRFSAMEATTGAGAAIVAGMLARRECGPPGARPPEAAVPAAPFLEALRARGIRPREILEGPP